MSYRIAFIAFTILVFSCRPVESGKETIRIQPSATKFEDVVKLPVKQKFSIFSHFNSDTVEYFTYLSGHNIYLVDIGSKSLKDSINVSLDSAASAKYGIIRSFCFNGKDSLFALFDQGIFFWNKKKLAKIIPINRHDTVQYSTFRFQNLEDVPIFYDKATQSIVGEVFCSDCWITEPAYYRQKLVGSVSMVTGKIKLFNISYPKKYVQNYFGFDMKPYGQTTDSVTLLSFPCDDKVYVLNRKFDKLARFSARSIYQTDEAQPLLPLSDSGSIEQKMRHMSVEPYYSEIISDGGRQLFYRFFRKAIPIKNENGTYNDFFKKGLVLMVINSEYHVIGEYELPKYYNSYISFAGKAGLYLIDISNNPEKTNATVFHVLTFK